jgi:hypothetical protein
MRHTRDELHNDDPITLAGASKLLLRGIVTVSALRAEIKRDNLVAEKIGRTFSLRQQRSAKCEKSAESFLRFETKRENSRYASRRAVQQQPGHGDASYDRFQDDAQV